MGSSPRSVKERKGVLTQRKGEETQGRAEKVNEKGVSTRVKQLTKVGK